MVIVREGYISIDENGYLNSEDSNEVIYSAYLREFEIMHETNRKIYQLIESINTSRSDEIGAFLLSVFVQLHKAFQSIVLLLSRGLEEQAKVILRTLLERLMIIAAINNNPENYRKWILNQENERKRLIDNINNNRPGVGHLKNEIKNIDVPEEFKRMTFKEWAIEAGMEERYYQQYFYLSGHVHYSTEGYRETRIVENGEFIGLSIAPRYREIRALAISAMEFVKDAVLIIGDYFKLNDSVTNIFKGLYDEIREETQMQAGGTDDK